MKGLAGPDDADARMALNVPIAGAADGGFGLGPSTNQQLRPRSVPTAARMPAASGHFVGAISPGASATVASIAVQAATFCLSWTGSTLSSVSSGVW